MYETLTVTAGLAIRRQFRRWLIQNNLKFTEDKGWIDSLFVFEKPQSQAVMNQLIAIQKHFQDN